MKNFVQFHRSRSKFSGETTPEPIDYGSGLLSRGTASILPEKSFCEFLLSSPLSGSELFISRDYVHDREIEIQS